MSIRRSIFSETYRVVEKGDLKKLKSLIRVAKSLGNGTGDEDDIIINELINELWMLKLAITHNQPKIAEYLLLKHRDFMKKVFERTQRIRETGKGYVEYKELVSIIRVAFDLGNYEVVKLVYQILDCKWKDDFHLQSLAQSEWIELTNEATDEVIANIQPVNPRRVVRML